MKPFLGIDLTIDKKNEQLNGNNFLVQEPSLAKFRWEVCFSFIFYHRIPYNQKTY